MFLVLGMYNFELLLTFIQKVQCAFKILRYLYKGIDDSLLTFLKYALKEMRNEI